MALDQEFQLSVDTAMANSAEVTQVVMGYLSNLNRKFYPKADVEFVTQKGYRTRYDVYDAYFFAQIHTMISHGLLIGCRIEMGDEPRSDESGKWFNQVLGGLASPFKELLSRVGCRSKLVLHRLGTPTFTFCQRAA